jgi:hypothetical protein
VLTLILMNCITMAIEAGADHQLSAGFGFSSKAAVLNTLDLLFAVSSLSSASALWLIGFSLLQIVFTLELMAKVIGGGFLFAGKSSYLLSPWYAHDLLVNDLIKGVRCVVRRNCLDFLVVLLSWLNFVDGFDNFSYLRLLRVLRPLKAISSFPGMRLMVSAMIASTTALGDVLSVFAFILFVFALVGCVTHHALPSLTAACCYSFAGCNSSRVNSAIGVLMRPRVRLRPAASATPSTTARCASPTRTSALGFPVITAAPTSSARTRG